MRILLRQQETGLYLQPGGGWAPSRATAREFLSAIIAYWWAVEQKLFGSEVVLTFAEAHKEFVPMRLRPNERRSVIDCLDSEWAQAVHSSLLHGFEVDLINFDYAQHGRSSELLAQAFAVSFNLDRDPDSDAAYFRKKHTSRSENRKPHTP